MSPELIPLYVETLDILSVGLSCSLEIKVEGGENQACR